MNLREALNLDLRVPEVICFVGAGGKTTAMFRLAAELKALGGKVLVTTTTNIAYPRSDQCDSVILDATGEAGIFSNISAGAIVCWGGGIVEKEIKKFMSVEPGAIDRIYRSGIFDCILVEADGAKHKPIKAPAQYEPVIPASTTTLIGSIGLDAIGRPINDTVVHRPGLFCAITGKSMHDAIRVEDIISLVAAPDGLFKGAGVHAKKILLLNKADTPELQRYAKNSISGIVSRYDGLTCCIIASVEAGMVHEVVGC